MPKLSTEEKERARQFRDEQQGKLTQLCVDDPVEYYPPNFLANLRHLCPARQERSTAMGLKEVYVLSTDGRFGFIYKEGKCNGCRQRARSKAGRLVDAHDRPPNEGRVARGSAPVRTA